MYFASYITNLQCFTESFLTGTSTGHSRDRYVNIGRLLLWLPVLCLPAMGELQWEKWACSSDNINCPKADWALSLCVSAVHMWKKPLPLTCMRCHCLLLPREYGIPVRGKSLSPAPFKPECILSPLLWAGVLVVSWLLFPTLSLWIGGKLLLLQGRGSLEAEIPGAL